MRIEYSSKDVVARIIERFKANGIAQAPGLSPFYHVPATSEKAIRVRRQNGNEVEIPLSRLVTAIDAVRNDVTVYSRGPNQLRRFGIAGVNSVIYALLHLVSYEELTQ